ncbi:unnamed protein product, partial [marine sediment metagenome]
MMTSVQALPAESKTFREFRQRSPETESGMGPVHISVPLRRIMADLESRVEHPQGA